MKSFFRILFLSILVAGCSSGSKIIRSSDISKEFVFPYGVYQHDVQLTIEGGQHHHFNGVAQLMADRIQIVALSPFGTTVFKIYDDFRAKKITAEIYVEEMKKFEPKLLGYYAVLKKLLTTRNTEDSLSGHGIRVDDETLFFFGKLDPQRIPESMKIESKKYQVEIKVTGYEI